MNKDSITGEEVIDYDFLGKKLYPPKKLRMTDAGKEIAAFFRELDRMYYPAKKERKEVKHSFLRGHAAQKQPCTVKMYYTESKEQHVKFLRNYMPQKNKKAVVEKPDLFNDKYDVVIPYMYTGTQYKYSLFTKRNNLDCSEIAKKLGEIDGLGGGGHAQAAGFQTYHNIFESNIVEIN